MRESHTLHLQAQNLISRHERLLSGWSQDLFPIHDRSAGHSYVDASGRIRVTVGKVIILAIS
jgi:hypothetical protein